MEYLISAAQIALASLFAAAVASANRQELVPINILILMGSSACAYAFHMLVFIPILFHFVTWRNPWIYMWKFRFAYRKAFRTGSADDSLDKTVECAVESGEISPAVAGFVLPLGIDLNLNGAGIYYPLAVLYLSAVGGFAEDVTWGERRALCVVAVCYLG